jgi:hypothetical protein
MSRGAHEADLEPPQPKRLPEIVDDVARPNFFEDVARRDGGSDVPVKGVVGAGVLTVEQRGRPKKGPQIGRRQSGRRKFEFLGDHSGRSRASPILTDSKSQCFIPLQNDPILSQLCRRSPVRELACNEFDSSRSERLPDIFEGWLPG